MALFMQLNCMTFEERLIAQNPEAQQAYAAVLEARQEILKLEKELPDFYTTQGSRFYGALNKLNQANATYNKILEDLMKKQ